MLNKLILLLTLVSSASNSFAQKHESWREIIPLRSNRQDVEKLLGSPTGECKCFYKTDKETIIVYYSKAPCEHSGGRLEGWNVASDTVLGFTVRLEYMQSIEELNPNLGNFVKTTDDSLTTYFTNPEMGIQYVARFTSFTDNGISFSGYKVINIEYLPKKSDSHLRCKGFSNFDPVMGTYKQYLTLYGGIWGNDMAGWDNFSFAMTTDYKDYKGYIIIYSGSNTSVKELKTYMNKLRTHLFGTRSLKVNQVKIIEGGKRGQFEAEFFILPENYPPPSPSTRPM